MKWVIVLIFSLSTGTNMEPLSPDSRFESKEQCEAAAFSQRHLDVVASVANTLNAVMEDVQITGIKSLECVQETFASDK